MKKNNSLTDSYIKYLLNKYFTNRDREKYHSVYLQYKNTKYQTKSIVFFVMKNFQKVITYRIIDVFLQSIRSDDKKFLELYFIKKKNYQQIAMKLYTSESSLSYNKYRLYEQLDDLLNFRINNSTVYYFKILVNIYEILLEYKVNILKFSNSGYIFNENWKKTIFQRYEMFSNLIHYISNFTYKQEWGSNKKREIIYVKYHFPYMSATEIASTVGVDNISFATGCLKAHREEVYKFLRKGEKGMDNLFREEPTITGYISEYGKELLEKLNNADKMEVLNSISDYSELDDYVLKDDEEEDTNYDYLLDENGKMREYECIDGELTIIEGK